MTTTETTEVENEATANPFEEMRDNLPFDFNEQDIATQSIIEQILLGLVKINEANEVLKESKGTKTVELDKKIKEYDGDNEEIKSLAKQREELETQLKELVEKVRNTFRVEVLGEEAQKTPTVDKAQVQAARKVVLDLTTALKGYATINKNDAVNDWIGKLEIPQVDREGSTIVGQKKARVYVTIGDETFESFGMAAKHLSKGKEDVSSTDLNLAWADSGEQSEFTFSVNGEDRVIKVQKKEKNKKSDDDSTDSEVDADEDFEPAE